METIISVILTIISIVFLAFIAICFLSGIGVMFITVAIMLGRIFGAFQGENSERKENIPTLNELLDDYDLTDDEKKDIQRDENFHEILLVVMYEMFRNGGRRSSYREITQIFTYMYQCRCGANHISVTLLCKFASQFADKYCTSVDEGDCCLITSEEPLIPLAPYLDNILSKSQADDKIE